MMSRLLKFSTAFLIILIFLNISGPTIKGEETTKRVLFISSYHAGFDTLPDQIEGLRSVFDASNVQLDIDYMDSKIHNTEENYNNYYDFLKYRIDNTEPYDVVLVGDDNGLQFLLDHRSTLFTDVPIVFFCINDIDRAQIASSTPLTTGIIEGISIHKNLNMALELFPKTGSIIGIVDNTRTGIGDAQMFIEASTQYSDLTFELLNSSDYDTETFKTKIQEIDDNALIFYLSMFENKDGNIISIDQAVAILDAYAQVPIFRMTVGGLGDGIFGGNMVSYVEQGKAAAEMALSIIGGANPDTIDLIEESPNKNFFDYKKLKAYDITLNDLPQGSVILNKPTNYFEIYRAVLIPGAVILLILSAFIIILTKDNRQLKAKDKELQENNLELAALYEEIFASEEELRDQFNTLNASQKALNESEERYRTLAYTDTLTQLNNRPAALDFLDDYVKDLTRKWYLLYIDLDNFKYINDSRGHEVGDEILRVIGQRLNSFEDEFVYIGRLGGDEFIIVIDDSITGQSLDLFTDKLMRTIKDAIDINDMVFYLTCSIGVSVFPKDGYEKNILLRKADMAMYRAKESGRSRCTYFNNEIELAFTDRMMIQNRIRDAIDKREFELYYQPQYDLKKNIMCGVEALLRWQDASKQFISPEVFIPIAEEQGIIGLIGQWVFNEASHQGAQWQEEALTNHEDVLIRISVNVSASEIIEDNFGERFVKIIGDNGFKCEQITVEITESILITAKEKAIKALNYLKAHNIEIHLDDFGSGFSSLNYMIDLPIDVIKIDRAFINAITTDKKNKDMTKFIIDISHRFNLKVIAEGVETKEQFDLLCDMDCDMIQGYYYGKPMNAEDVKSFFHSPDMQL